MNKPTQEQKRKFWAYFGFIGRYVQHRTSTGLWGTYAGYEYPDGRHRVLLPPISLNSLSKWVVPSLQNKGYQIDIICFEHKGFAVSLLDICKDTAILSDIRNDDLTLALFWAVWKVVLNGKDDS